MNLIFFVYRCNSLIGFDGKINNMLSVSVVKVVKTVWLTKCQTNSTPEKKKKKIIFTYQNLNIPQ